jgi:hypothetical protein
MELCYAVCGTAWAGCYGAAGLVADTIAAGTVCNALEGACMAGCVGGGGALFPGGGFVAIPAIGVALVVWTARNTRNQSRPPLAKL